MNIPTKVLLIIMIIQPERIGIIGEEHLWNVYSKEKKNFI